MISLLPRARWLERAPNSCCTGQKCRDYSWQVFVFKLRLYTPLAQTLFITPLCSRFCSTCEAVIPVGEPVGSNAACIGKDRVWAVGTKCRDTVEEIREKHILQMDVDTARDRHRASLTYWRGLDKYMNTHTERSAMGM